MSQRRPPSFCRVTPNGLHQSDASDAPCAPLYFVFRIARLYEYIKHVVRKPSTSYESGASLKDTARMASRRWRRGDPARPQTQRGGQKLARRARIALENNKWVPIVWVFVVSGERGGRQISQIEKYWTDSHRTHSSGAPTTLTVQSPSRRVDHVSCLIGYSVIL